MREHVCTKPRAPLPPSVQNQAFTLTELLVVLAIIAIIAAILFPVFARAKSASHKSVDLVHIKQLALAQNIYSDDYDYRYIAFPYANVDSNPAYSNGEKGPFWTDRTMNYVKSQKIYNSTLNKDRVYFAAGYLNPGSDVLGEAPGYRVTYTLNPAISRAHNSPDTPGSSHADAVEFPSETVLIGPYQQAWALSSCHADPDNPNQTHLVWMFSDSNSFWGHELFGGKNEKGGFDGGVNFAYADLHAKFHRAVNEGTHPGDLYPYHGRDFFRGKFPQAKIYPNVSNDGTCPQRRFNAVY